MRKTRPKTEAAPDWLKPLVGWGAGPRAVQYLILGAKTRALLLRILYVSVAIRREEKNSSPASMPLVGASMLIVVSRSKSRSAPLPVK